MTEAEENILRSINQENKFADYESMNRVAEYESMARVMGSKGGGNEDEDIYGVTPWQGNPVANTGSRRASQITSQSCGNDKAGIIGKGTLIPVHMPVRARYSLNAFDIP